MAEILVASVDTPSEVSVITGSASGDYFQNDGRVELQVLNNASHPVVVTILAQRQPVWPLSCENYSFTVPANELTLVRTFAPQWFNDGSGHVQLRYPVGLSLASGGTGYSVGDELTVVGGGAIRPAKAVVLTHTGGVIDTIALKDAGLYNPPPSSPAATTALALNGVASGGSGATLNVTSEATNLQLNAYRNAASR